MLGPIGLPLMATLPLDVSGEYYDWTNTMAPERPWKHDYSQSLVMKFFLCEKNAEGGVGRVYMTFADAARAMERIDRATLGIPKIVYLVGWQYNGHDSKYPSWAEANAALMRNEDETALDSLRWLIREGRRHHTTVSLHVNMIDATPDSPLWEEYLGKDIIAKDKDGKPIPGEVFSGMQSYQISYAQEWRHGLTQKRIDGLLEMIPELKESGTIHIDAFHSFRPSGPGEPISPFLGISSEEEIRTQRKIFRYFRDREIDATCEGGKYWLRTDPFVGLQPMAWHFSADNFVNEEWPGKPAGFKELPPSLYVGTPFNAEPILMHDHEAMPGFLENVALRLAPWYLKNHRGNRPDCEILVNEEEAFVPALWTRDAYLAYSRRGFGQRSFGLPSGWKGSKAILRKITLDRVEELGIVNVVEDRIRLTIEPETLVSVQPVS